MLVVGELAPVRADRAHDDERGRHVDAVDARQVHPAHLEQPRAQVELGRIARLRALLALGRFDLGGLQYGKLRLDLGVALGELLATEVEGIEGLLQGEQVFGAP